MRILFVCMGNYCRSPTAESVFRKLLAERAPHLHVEVDSAGTHDYHAGSAPDPRSCAAALARGVDLRGLRARQIVPEDFERFDLILAMDESNVSALRQRCPPHLLSRVRLFMEYAGHPSVRAVPDPYYGGPHGFERVLDLVEEASIALIDRLLEEMRR